MDETKAKEQARLLELLRQRELRLTREAREPAPKPETEITNPWQPEDTL